MFKKISEEYIKKYNRMVDIERNIVSKYLK